MDRLFERLKDYGEADIYPCHMPGHKRHGMGALPEQLAKLDITEVEGFDNLHQPEGYLRELQQYAAMVYGAEESYYLVGGSTCGILSAVSAAIPRGGRLLVARNCHKSIYHAAYLRQLKLSYLYPHRRSEVDICEAISAGQVREELERQQDIQGVLIVSPTYEGRIAEVEEIAEIVHDFGIPLIVDEAHGAHLGFHSAFARGSSRAGADLVVTSVHKTLPAMTQAALLHVNGSLVDRRLLRRFLSIYQSSSPSYVLMASIENALHLAFEDGQMLFQQMFDRWKQMLERLAVCRALTIWPPVCLPLTEYQKHQDIGKLIISTRDTETTGQQLYQVLLEKYGLQMEMACDSYVLAMFTIGDEESGYERLTRALLELDSRMARAASGSAESKKRDVTSWEKTSVKESEESRTVPQEKATGKESEESRTAPQEKAAGRELKPSRAMPQEKTGEMQSGANRESIPLSECWDQSVEWIALKDAVGRYAGEFVNIYPPGTPILVPGEKIREGDRKLIRRYLEDGLKVQGITMHNAEPVLAVLAGTTRRYSKETLE